MLQVTLVRPAIDRSEWDRRPSHTAMQTVSDDQHPHAGWLLGVTGDVKHLRHRVRDRSDRFFLRLPGNVEIPTPEERHARLMRLLAEERQPYTQWNLLQCAAHAGHLHVLQYVAVALVDQRQLVQSMMNPFAVLSWSHRTLLMIAAASGHVDVVRWLLYYAHQHGLEREMVLEPRDGEPPTRGFTALHFAVERGHVAVVAVLAEKQPALMDMRCEVHGLTPWQWAVKLGGRRGRSTPGVRLQGWRMALVLRRAATRHRLQMWNKLQGRLAVVVLRTGG